MNCHHFGCEHEVRHHDKGYGFVCPEHGIVTGVLVEDPAYLRLAQWRLAFESAELIAH